MVYVSNVLNSLLHAISIDHIMKAGVLGMFEERTMEFESRFHTSGERRREQEECVFLPFATSMFSSL